MGIPNDPGQYPGRPSPGAGFNRQRLINLALFIPFLFFTALSIAQYEIPHYRHRLDYILPRVIALIILVFVIRNKVVKYRLRRRNGVI